MATPKKTQAGFTKNKHQDDYHVLIQQENNVWHAELQDTQTGEVVTFMRPIDLVRWLERRAKQTQLPSQGLT